MFSFRTFNTTMQSVHLHLLCITILIFFELYTRHYIIGTKANIVYAFLVVFLLCGGLLLFGFCSLSGGYGHYGSVNMWGCFIQMQYCRNNILFSIGFLEPVQIIPTPLIKLSTWLDSLHIIRATGQENTNCPDLVLSDLTSQTYIV